MWLMQNALEKPDNAGAGSTDYLHLFGLVALGYMWAQMAKAAQASWRRRRRRRRCCRRKLDHRPLLHGARACRRPRRISPASEPAPTRMMALPAEAF